MKSIKVPVKPLKAKIPHSKLRCNLSGQSIRVHCGKCPEHRAVSQGDIFMRGV